jgi:hypothetical protein
VSYHEIRGLVTAVRTACLILTAAASGMRTSELLELRVGSRLSPRMVTGGGQRFRLASKVIKGRQFGGENDEWVVVAEVDQAIALAKRLHGGDIGEPVFGAMVFHTSYPRLRNWINGPAGHRLGLTPIPAGPRSASSKPDSSPPDPALGISSRHSPTSTERSRRAPRWSRRCWTPTVEWRTCSAPTQEPCMSGRPTTAGSATQRKRSACGWPGPPRRLGR